AETERFFRRGGGHDNRYCFELMRRALVERNEAAWSMIYQQYHSLVTGWICDHPQFRTTDEESAYFLNGVFASMWKACTPERFANFPDLPAVLAYLKSCVHTTIINHLRKRRLPVTAMTEELVGTPVEDGLAGAVLDKMARTDLWQLLDSLLHGEKERFVTELYFIQGMKPRAIYEQHADLFATIQDVYRTKQNLLERLSRNADLQQFYADLRENG
ncbi:MAG: hypothetical protein R2867_05915, partial [Caldilineaceae bacterium]